MRRFYLPKRWLTWLSAIGTQSRWMRRGKRLLSLCGFFLPANAAGSVKRRGVDVSEFFEAFDSLPDEGAEYFLRLCAVLPVASDPSASMNFSGVLKAGHGYLVVGKVQGKNSVSRAFGFYPATRMSLWSPMAPYPSMVRNDRRRLLHASLERPISPLDFEVVRVLAMAGSFTGYDLLHFNCADYALAVFNGASAHPLVPPPYAVQWMGIPIGYHRLPSRRQIIIPHTPQGLFLAMRALAAAGVPGAFIADKIGHGSR